jgi:hypothetical protein
VKFKYSGELRPPGASETLHRERVAQLERGVKAIKEGGAETAPREQARGETLARLGLGDRQGENLKEVASCYYTWT